MALLTITVRNTLRVYGIEPHNKWGVMIWGTSTWGQRDVEWTDYKYVPNTMTVNSTQGFRVSHKIEESLTLDTTISRQFGYQVTNTVNLSSRIASVYRINNGWYVTRGDITNALSFPVDSFTEVTRPATSWTVLTPPSTTWVQS